MLKHWKEFTAGGFVFANYTFLRVFDAITALVLCQLFTECNHAVKHGLYIYNYFLISVQRITDYLGISYNELNSALNDLIKENFIEVFGSGIEDTLLIQFEIDNIIHFKIEEEEAGMFHPWDWGLVNTQNPIGKATDFAYSTVALKNFIEQNISNPEKIPVVLYSLCNIHIMQYESCGKCFLEIQNLMELVYELVTKPDFKPEDLVLLVLNLCYEQ